MIGKKLNIEVGEEIILSSIVGFEPSPGDREWSQAIVCERRGASDKITGGITNLQSSEIR